MIIKKYILFLILIFSNTNLQAFFKLIIPLYNETKKERIEEYLFCLKKNLDHKLIDEIHVVYDTAKDDKTNYLLNYLKQLKNGKIKISYVKQWQTYQMCFELAKKIYPNKAIIISNADIYFDDTLNLLKDYNFNNVLLALTRWELINGEIKLSRDKRGRIAIWSNDTWIFKNPLKPFPCNIRIGTPGCDSAINYFAVRSRINVFNPCLSIKCIHVHESGIRNYTEADRIKVPYLFVRATKLFKIGHYLPLNLYIRPRK